MVKSFQSSVHVKCFWIIFCNLRKVFRKACKVLQLFKFEKKFSQSEIFLAHDLKAAGKFLKFENNLKDLDNV